MILRPWLFLVSALASEPAGSGTPPQRAREPEVWLCPARPELFERPEEWDSVRGGIAGVQFYVGWLHDTPVEGLRPAAAFLRREGIQVSVECGGTLNADWGDEAGEESARVELESIDKWYRAGGKLDFLNLDGPVRRLLGFDGWNQAPPFTSVRRCAEELVDYLREVRKAHPEIRFFLLTNFPNWGYRGETSYFPQEGNPMFYGDYDAVLREVLQQTERAGIRFTGLTVDNPYEYLVGEHATVGLRDPRRIDWLGRVRALEDFVRRRGYEFNLIANSDIGGNRSDQEFYERTLRMVDTYVGAGGRPTRYFVQSWYPHPKVYLPETEPTSMTALVKAVLLRLHPRSEARSSGRALVRGSRVVLMPDPEGMGCGLTVPGLPNQLFVLVIPETIGSREEMLLNFPDVSPRWKVPEEDGSIACEWTTEGRIRYAARLVPGEDFVDVEMEIENLTSRLWQDVFSFNCLNPTGAAPFRDLEMKRTWISREGNLLRLAETTRPRGPMPTVGFYLHESVPAGQEPSFVRGFEATNAVRTDRPWIVTLSDAGTHFMAAAAPEAVFLFNNVDRGCIHAAPSFGDIGPREKGRAVARFYFARGGVSEFLRRWREDLPGLERRGVRARAKRAAIELRPIPPPGEAASSGTFGFEARPAWMKGSLLVRFPEALRSAGSQHFPGDQPPPPWWRDEATGEIHFRAQGPDGLAFFGKARPYEEEIYLEFGVRNGSAETLHNVAGRFCVDLSRAEGFSGARDLRRTFCWIEEGLRSFADLPDPPRDKSGRPWVHLVTLRAPELPLPDDPDGWWVAGRRADFGLIARTDEAGENGVAVAWEDAPSVGTNTALPCLHADPRPRSLEPGEAAVWRGKIFFHRGRLAGLRERYLADPVGAGASPR